MWFGRDGPRRSHCCHAERLKVRTTDHPGAATRGHRLVRQAGVGAGVGSSEMAASSPAWPNLASLVACSTSANSTAVRLNRDGVVGAFRHGSAMNAMSCSRFRQEISACRVIAASPPPPWAA